MRYAWIITADKITDPGDKPDVGITGPSDAPAELLARLNDGHGQQFRLYDDDNILYYEGRIVTADDTPASDSDELVAFAPLADFGIGWAGCTRLDYFDGHDWRTI